MFQNIKSSLLPIPKKIQKNGKTYIFPKKLSIHTSSCHDIRYKHACNSIRTTISGTGLEISIETQGHETNEYILTIGTSNLSKRDNIKSGGYQIDISDDLICIVSNDISGFISRTKTLTQIIRTCLIDKTRIPGLHIEDYPDYPWRGFMIDAARAPSPIEYIKHIIEICSEAKLNFLIFREGDDELSAVRYKNLPLGHENPFSFNFGQIQNLIHHAFLHGIEFIPEIESFGHSAAKRIHYPQLIKGGGKLEYPPLGYHMRKMHMDPDNTQSLNLLQKMFEEWMQVTTAPFIHLGCDEVKLPLSIQETYLRKVLSVFDKASVNAVKVFKPIVWSDAPLIDSSANLTRCLWCYEEHHDLHGPPSFENSFLKHQNINQYYEVDRHTVFMAGGSGSGHTPYSRGSFPDVIDNLIHWSKLGSHKSNWQGILAVQWSGNMLNQWLGDFFAVAELGWNAANASTSTGTICQQIQSYLNSVAAVDPHQFSGYQEMWDGIALKDGQFHRDYVITPEQC